MSDNKSRTEPLLPEELVEIVEKFIREELETRQQSFLPGPDQDQEGYIADAVRALSAITALRVQPPEASEQACRDALQGIIDIGKRDMSNPKYDAYFDSAKEALRAGAPTDRAQNRPVGIEAILKAEREAFEVLQHPASRIHLADLAQANAIEQCAVEAGERSPEGVSSHTMLGDMWDRRIRNLRDAKPGNAAPTPESWCMNCTHAESLHMLDGKCCICSATLHPCTGYKANSVAPSVRTTLIPSGDLKPLPWSPDVAPTATPAQDKAKK